MFQFIEDAVLAAATAWWMPWAVFLLCFIDGFFPVVPSESVIVALASLSAGHIDVNLGVLFLLGWVGAVGGDQVAYWIGRSVGVSRFRWMRTRSVRRAVGAARNSLATRGALVITTARHIPGGRVAVNFTAGASRYPWWRFTALDVVSAAIWAAYSILIGRFTAGWFENTLLQIALALVIAVVIGFGLDFVIKRVLARAVAREESAPVDSKSDSEQH